MIPTILRHVLRPPHRLHSTYERLLGTEVEVQVVARTAAQAEAAEQAALTEIDRLTRIFNRFDPGSELCRWQARPGDAHVPLSLELLHVLRLADHWRALSGGAFHPGADALGQLWQQAAATGQRPSPAALERQVSALRAAPWTLHADGSATLHAAGPLGLNALAKGYVVDRAALVASRCVGVRSVLINVGGDLRVTGPARVNVQVADPFTARDDAPPTARVQVRGGALATSGQAHRGFTLNGTHYSHVMDPRSGQPVQDVPGVTVTAPECVTADALATILSVLDVRAGLHLLAGLPECEALIVTADGQRHASPGWRGVNLTRGPSRGARLLLTAR
ncbi:FAD:protein FMN transferase [Deinococcus soli (ex Cha et al. 2016)]|uniref:FAD:protein FMN transferase n=2 Tax=Deinococcus soli (ex Cha et al. 2016) TaxID=1309411 RepID=A0AAE4BL33_9DEIO|nr:FAD:protein FMN transferase [Deinococcus soli (ex Cha et al. 2016)]MDR6216814.1 thiamine biosynthesis lipoprotein [Deinococcus soli (ex Cha et al. 2016)]MDR6327635.1 thiamine biosynthesis lipoprotein [Deinococcus soli (ex Cha et al. 2016)]MDR6749910.1 thiamine biosynthesis lipoprotein [Deinococcus soli (ex Cha et al. 2016)]